MSHIEIFPDAEVALARQLDNDGFDLHFSKLLSRLKTAFEFELDNKVFVVSFWFDEGMSVFQFTRSVPKANGKPSIMGIGMKRAGSKKLKTWLTLPLQED